MKKSFLYIYLLFVTNFLCANVYYISPGGDDDNNSGTSPSDAWQTIDKVNTLDLEPGDTVFFEGGEFFSGNIYFDPDDAGIDTLPILVSSYGTGRATVNAGTDYGFYAYNVAGIIIKNINFTGDGYDVNENHGIFFYNDLTGDIKLDYIYIDSVEISGFKEAAVTIGAWNGNSGFNNVSITHANVHDNGKVGINTWGFFDQDKTGYSHSNVYVAYCYVYNIFGLALSETHSGSGIIIGDVDTGIVEYCVAHDCGINNIHCGGPVGIWAWDCNNISIQHNEAYNISCGSGCDGGGFDLDGGVTNSVMQYNYSHDNEGAGFLVAQFEGARPMYDNVIRYNISENDGIKNNYGGITLWVSETNNNGGNNNLMVYNNTLFTNNNTSPTGRGVVVWSQYHNNIRFYNNIIYATNGSPLIDASFNSIDVLFLNNSYYDGNDGQEYLWIWGADTYSTLQAFRDSTGQEIYNNNDVGVDTDPFLSDPGNGGIIGNPEQLADLAAYQLLQASPLINQGFDLETLFSINTGYYDFYGINIPVSFMYDVGAHEYDNPVNIESESMNNTVTLYPNPANDIIYIKNPEKVKKVEVYDFFGRMVYVKQNTEDRLFFSPEKKGIYYLKIRLTNGNIECHKVIFVY